MADMTPEQVITGVADILALHYPHIWQALRRDHTPDSTGHCRACRWSAGAARWPCTLWIVADLAAQHPHTRNHPPVTHETQTCHVR
jgi:hypothetical protein